MTLFSKMNIESKNINVVNRTKSTYSTLIFLFFCQYVDKVGTSFSKLSIKQLLPLSAIHGGAAG